MLDLKPVRGMRDFYPAQMRLRQWLFNQWREVSENFNFLPYDAPLVENLDLLKRKAGEDIAEQLYTFQDKSGRDLALRAEMTPSLARMITSRFESLSMPVKWYTIAQCFRYERTTKGRKREHYQWNVDILGEDSVSAEAEIILLLVQSLKKLGLSAEQVKVKISSRNILEALMNKLDIPPEFHQPVMMTIDKKDKMSESEFDQLISDKLPRKIDIQPIFDMFKLGSPQEISRFMSGLKSACCKQDQLDKYIEDLDQLIQYLNPVDDFIQIDFSIVRGLAYYTGIVFEVYYQQGKARAIAGGGRYSQLLEKIGGKPLSGVGFGFGDVVILDILKETSNLPQVHPQIDYYIIPFEQKNLKLAFSLLDKLTQQGKRTEIDLKFRSLRNSLKDASRDRCNFVIILFPNEVAQNQVVVKDLIKGDERKVNLRDL